MSTCINICICTQFGCFLGNAAELAGVHNVSGVNTQLDCCPAEVLKVISNLLAQGDPAFGI